MDVKSEFVPEEDNTVQYFVNVLEMSHLWCVEEGQAYAKRQLAAKVDLSPSYKLFLARRFDIYDWVEPIVIELLNCPLDNLKGQEISDASVEVFAIIFKARERYRDDLFKLALAPPPLPKDSHSTQNPWCATHRMCEREWEKVWFTKVARKLMLGDDRLTPAGILPYLSGLVYSDMRVNCRREAFSFLESQPQLFTLKERIQSAAISAVKRVLGVPANV